MFSARADERAVIAAGVMLGSISALSGVAGSLNDGNEEVTLNSRDSLIGRTRSLRHGATNSDRSYGVRRPVRVSRMPSARCVVVPSASARTIRSGSKSRILIGWMVRQFVNPASRMQHMRP